MAILKIRDANGEVKEIVALKGGLTKEQQDMVNTIGSAKEAFSIDSDRWDHGVTENEDGTVSEYYFLYIDISGTNLDLIGKTITIKTYAHGSMGYRFAEDGLVGDTTVVNPDANVTENPDTGVCEFTVTIPDKTWEYEFWLEVDFEPNPYTELEAYVKKDTLWNEIKALSNSTVIACGYTVLDGVYWYYRKWGDGFAECWAEFGKEGYLNEEFETFDSVGFTLPLPVSFLLNPYDTYGYDTNQVTATFYGYTDWPDGEPVIRDAARLEYAMFNDGFIDMSAIVPKGTTNIQCTIYLHGMWK